MDGSILGLAILIGLSLYFLPTIIVEIRGAEHGARILWVNLIFGWTVLGWIAALIWALTKKAPTKVEPVHLWPVENDSWNFHARQLNEDSAIYQDDHWVLGIEDSSGSPRNRQITNPATATLIGVSPKNRYRSAV